jgi:Sulfotransferase domain
MKRPRTFKTHYPVQLAPHQVWTAKPKIVHISRDIKDVACSLYHNRIDHHHEKIENIEDHFEEILNDKIYYGPYREHVLNWQNLPDYENILYLTYEEMVTNTVGVILKIAKFLDKSVNADQMEKLIDYLSFKKMKGWLKFY